MNEAMNNIPSNINQATLFDLSDDGLITFENESQGGVLDKNIIKTFGGLTIYVGEKVKLGELTVSEMIRYLGILITAIS